MLRPQYRVVALQHGTWIATGSRLVRRMLNAGQGFWGEVQITEAGQSFSRVLDASMQDR